MTDEAEELRRILNVKVAEIDDFENEFATKVGSAMIKNGNCNLFSRWNQPWLSMTVHCT